jgi:hypothetical protein
MTKGNKMIKRLRPLMGTMFVYALLLSVCASLSMAQSRVKSAAKLERERVDRIMNAGANIEEFRTEMKNYLTDFANAMSNLEAIPAMREQNKKHGVNPAVALDRAIANIDKMPAEGLARMRDAYAQYPNWRQGPRNIYEISQRLGNDTSTQTTKGNKTRDITPDVIITDDCPDISGVPSFADIAVLKGFIVLNEGIIEALPTDGLTILAREAPVVTYTLALAALDVAETLRAQYDLCTSPTTEDVRNIVAGAKTEIITKLDAGTTTITNAISASQTAIINNDNANKTTIVNNDNANTLALTNLINTTRVAILNTIKDSKEETNNLLLRTQIEADLSSTDGSTFVALYETPGNVCLPSLNQKGLPQIGALSSPVQCGLLDLVRSIVRDTIANVGAGTNAQKFFETAEAQRAAGKYKDAYASYRQAYKAASK